MKVYSDFIPDGCNYLTAGKRYEVEKDGRYWKTCGTIICDNGETAFVYFESSSLLDGKPWSIEE